MNRGLWGAATSAHQVEGGNRANDWWAWEEAGRVPEKSGEASDHYRRFREDFRLARELGHTAHRLSLEWSRLEPREGEWDEAAFRHYEEVFDSLRSFGLEPVVTLHHFTNPLWFAEKGGWTLPGATEKFSRYVSRVVQRFSPYVKYWITINEPLIYVYQGFVLGRWPPGERSFDKALGVIRELMRAHIAAYQILHRDSRNSECYVSLAHHTIVFTPCRPNWRDRATCFLRHWFVNRLILRSLQTGFVFFPGVFCERLPAKGTLDFLGINYYSRDFIRSAGWGRTERFGEVCPKDHHRGQIGELNDLGWEVYPEGLYQVIASLRSLRLPVLITENGVTTPDDSLRERSIEAHLAELRRARNEGVTVWGYFYWSLVDNFEWAEGFGHHFGIVGVDYATQARKVRPSAGTLRKGCQDIFGTRSKET